MHVEKHHTIEQLRRHAAAIPDWRTRRRVEAVILAREGMAGDDIAERLQVAPVSVNNWIAVYNKLGLAPLIAPKTGGGRQRLIVGKARDALDDFVDHASQPIRTRDIARLLKTRHGLTVSRDTIASELTKRGFVHGWIRLKDRCAR